MSIRISRYILLFALLGLTCFAALQAQEQMYQPRPLPERAWQVLNAASGVLIGGEGATEAQVQVIFDVHCPYCARLYKRLERDYPGLSVRWVPIGYFRPNSEQIAAAILATSDPASSLSENFHKYDYTRKRGGFRAPPYDQYRLSSEHRTLQQHWLEWGAFTPMIIVRTGMGRVWMAWGASKRFLRPALGKTESK